MHMLTSKEAGLSHLFVIPTVTSCPCSRTFVSVIMGIVAGILGITGVSGFLVHLISQLLVSPCLIQEPSLAFVNMLQDEIFQKYTKFPQMVSICVPVQLCRHP